MKILKTIFILLVATTATAAKAQEMHERDAESSEVSEIGLNDSHSIRLGQISQNEYVAGEQQSARLRQKPYKAVRDIDKAWRMLGNRIKTIEVHEDDCKYSILEITFKDGVRKRLNWCGDEWGKFCFIAYYPKLGVLVLRNEVEGEYPIDLNDSANERHVGNPDYHVVSPDRQWRITGYEPGGAVDGTTYFIERWNRPKKKYEFAGYLNYPYAGNWFWTDNDTVLFCDNIWSEEFHVFYELKIITK